MLSSRALRVVASLVDWLYSLLLAIPLGFALAGGAIGLGGTLGAGSQGLAGIKAGAIGVVGWVIFAVIGLLWLWMMLVQWLSVARHGATLGKRLVGIRMIDGRGVQVGFYRGVFLRQLLFVPVVMTPQLIAWIFTPRWFAEIVTFCTSVFFVVDVLAALGPERRTFHDAFAGTRVVNAIAAPVLRTAAVLGAGGAIVAVVVGVGVAVAVPGFWSATATSVLTAVMPEPESAPTPPSLPPPAPPAPPPPIAAPPVAVDPPPPPEPPTPSAPPPSRMHLYTDDSGVSHIVDSLDKVPARYRDRVR